MTKKVINKQGPSLPWRFFISMIGFAMILLGISHFLLFFFGVSTHADVHVQRVGGSDDAYSPEDRYEWSVDYDFTDREGLLHRGHSTRRGSDYSVSVEERVYYFPSAPFINALEAEVEPNAGQLIYLLLGAFLIWAMNHRSKKIRRAPSKPIDYTIDPHEPDDYDDSLEARFHDSPEVQSKDAVSGKQRR